MGTGTDVVMESSGVTLLHGDLMGIVKARQQSQATMRNIRLNLWFAFGYNVLGIPVAAGDCSKKNRSRGAFSARTRCT
jgi:Cu+-exporting ATPase